MKVLHDEGRWVLKCMHHFAMRWMMQEGAGPELVLLLQKMGQEKSSLLHGKSLMQGDRSRGGRKQKEHPRRKNHDGQKKPGCESAERN